MFDSILVDCPECNTRLEIQSKAGKCGLEEFRINSVPLEIACDVEGEYIRCDSCETTFILNAVAGFPKTSPMILTKMY